MARRHGVLSAALAALLLLITGCASNPVRLDSARPATCAAKAPSFVLPARSAGRGGLVPAGPVGAVVCQYAAQKVTGMPRTVRLSGPAAAGLAAVLNSAGPLSAADRHCVRPGHRDPFQQEIILTYLRGEERTAGFAGIDCDLGLVTSGGRTGVLPAQTADDLFYYTSLTTRRDGSAPVPDLIGLTAAAVDARARADHFIASVDGAVLDATARPGTVVFQSPPPGGREGGPGKGVDVLLAARPAPGCTARQLAATYRGGGAGAGNDFGLVLIRDRSARPCTLAGPLRVTGLGPGGRPDTQTVSDLVSGVAVLTPAAGGRRPPTGAISLVSEYRDGPARVHSGYCQPFWVVPVTWRIALPGGGALAAPNVDARNPIRLVRSGGLVTCQGRLGIAGPVTVGPPPGR